MRHPYSLSLFLSALLLLGCAATRHLDSGVTRSLMTPEPTALAAASAIQRQLGATTEALLLLQVPPAPAPPRARGQVGRASYYHPSLDGCRTANGETFSSQLMTAAHRTLEFGTRVRVTNLVNLKSVVVTINDRGPYVSGRIIDLSRRAASALGFVHDGVTRVRVEPLL